MDKKVVAAMCDIANYFEKSGMSEEAKEIDNMLRDADDYMNKQAGVMDNLKQMWKSVQPGLQQAWEAGKTQYGEITTQYQVQQLKNQIAQQKQLLQKLPTQIQQMEAKLQELSAKQPQQQTAPAAGGQQQQSGGQPQQSAGQQQAK